MFDFWLSEKKKNQMSSIFVSFFAKKEKFMRRLTSLSCLYTKGKHEWRVYFHGC